MRILAVTGAEVRDDLYLRGTDALDDLAPDDYPGTPLRVVCHRCGRSLGRYFVVRYGDIITIVPKGALGNWRRGRLLYVDRGVEADMIHYEWTCGCGAKGDRRADRMGVLPVTPDVSAKRGGWVLEL